MSLQQHLPVLLVVLPLLSAPLTVLLRNRTLAFGVVCAASWVGLVISILIWQQVQVSGTISYEIGSWAPPLGIEYRVDQLSAFVLVLVSAIAALVVPYSRASIETEVPTEQHYLFYTMFALCLTGLLGITITGDAFNIFVFLEVSSLATYVLIALGQNRRALLASYQYLIMGTIGATLLVIGIGFLYLMTGSLNLVDISNRLGDLNASRPVLVALAFITVGVSLKLALFPLHQWLPNAYTYAPSSVSSFLAATATKVAIYVLLRFYFSVFDHTIIFGALPLQAILMALALAGMFAASTIAIFQSDLRRLFAFSSVGQVGYIILGMALNSVNGVTSSVLHLFNHGITKGAIFMLLGIVSLRLGGVQLSQLNGLAKRMPLTSFAIVVCGLSLIGVPGTAGFISKWYLLLAALEQNLWWLAFLIVASSLLAIMYVWRFVEVAYLQDPPADAPPVAAPPLMMAIPTGLLVLATAYFGLDTDFTVGSATAAAELLMGVAP
ncbi:monovalent cation/H+ antiporter subunit D family protein [Burkholderiaceae bacterium]|nr:monovalent cation/H+ antiporter subunit D family protein [Burkholderiaceae bacterium]